MIVLYCRDASDPPIEQVPQTQEIRITSKWRVERAKELWRELHSQQDATPEWFADWVKRVPNFGCGCRNWLKEYLQKNPPIYGEGFYEWTVTLHDAVNAKLGKPIWDRIVRFD